MKKTIQKLITFFSIIIITFSASSVWAQLWEGDYTIVTRDDISVLSGYTVVSGDLKIVSSDTLKSLRGLENITKVGGNLEILNNTSLASLKGLDNIASIGGNFWIEATTTLKV